MKFYVSLILLFCALGMWSQTMITQSFNEPSVGEVDRNYRLDTSAYTSGLPSSVTGSNVVWDFTKVQGSFPLIFDSIVAPSALASGSLFPSATYAQKRGGIHAFFRSNANPARTEWLGAYSPSLTVTFTNSAIVAEYPMSYGYDFTDPVTGTFNYGTTNGVCNGTINVRADGLGILNLPGNVSFANVIRLRSIETLTMTVGFFPVGYIRQSIFSYYVPNKKYPLITVQYQEYQLLAGTPTITAMAYGNFDYFTVAGIQGSESSMSAPIFYPQPAGEFVRVRLPDGSVPGETVLYRLDGVEIIREKSGSELYLGELPAGIYLVEIRSSARIHRGRIFKN